MSVPVTDAQFRVTNITNVFIGFFLGGNIVSNVEVITELVKAV